MADVSVRPARPEDAERVATVQLATWREAYGSLLPPEALELPHERVSALWLGAVEQPPGPRHRLLVAMDGHELVGYAVSAPYTPDPPEAPETGETDATAELSTVLVLPRFGRRGHASRLLAASVASWRQDGARTARTWVLDEDPATAAFLRGAGWQPDGARRGLDTGGRVLAQQRFHTDLSEGP